MGAAAHSVATTAAWPRVLHRSGEARGPGALYFSATPEDSQAATSYTEIMERLKKTWRKTPTTIRRPLVLIVGCLIIIAGILMLALPGPGWAAIFLGLAILATEFDRAEKLRAAIVRRFKTAIDKAFSKKKH